MEGMELCPLGKKGESCPFDTKRDGISSCTETSPLCSFGVLEKLRRDQGLEYTEIKAETAIDRLKGTAKHGSLRHMERVPPGIKFDFEIAFRRKFQALKID